MTIAVGRVGPHGWVAGWIKKQFLSRVWGRGRGRALCLGKVALPYNEGRNLGSPELRVLFVWSTMLSSLFDLQAVIRHCVIMDSGSRHHLHDANLLWCYYWPSFCSAIGRWSQL